MNFFFKPKPLVVDCFVSEDMSHVYEYAPIQLASRFYPQWWRNSARGELDLAAGNLQQSIKNCAGIQDHYAHGMIMPMWSELAIITNGQGGIVSQFSDQVSQNDYQGVDLRSGFRPDQINMKIISPWRFRSEASVYFNWLPVYWDQVERPSWEVLPATVEFNTNHVTNINLLVDGTAGSTVIKHSQPLAHIVPLSERPLSIVNHLVSAAEYALLANRSRPLTFVNKYRTQLGLDRCPFKK